jgi:hypothetical protein
MNPKPIKVTIDVFGVPVKAAFTRTEHNYTATISKTVAIKCYHAVAKRLVKNKLPKDTSITINANSCYYNTYDVSLMRCWEDENNKINKVLICVYANYNEGEITASHNLFDWLQACEKQNIVRKCRRLTDNRKIEHQTTTPQILYENKQKNFF